MLNNHVQTTYSTKNSFTAYIRNSPNSIENTTLLKMDKRTDSIHGLQISILKNVEHHQHYRIQIKTMTKCHYKSIGMDTVNKSKMPSAKEDLEQLKLSCLR